MQTDRDLGPLYGDKAFEALLLYVRGRASAAHGAQDAAAR
jgi:hypothetical protein